MKPRKVVLTLEAETDAPLSILRNRNAYCSMDVGIDIAYDVDVLQAQANVVEPWEGKMKVTKARAKQSTTGGPR